MINPQNVQILSQWRADVQNIEVYGYALSIPHDPDIMKKYDVVFGIDPGNKNMGLTILPTSPISHPRCYEIVYPSERSAILRLQSIKTALNDIMNYWGECNMLVSVEASAYSMRYRNTELAEARIIAAEWFLDEYKLTATNFVFPTPQAIRKAVFGSAKIKAEIQWPQLKGDAASSLAVALAGLQIANEPEKSPKSSH